VMWLAPSQTDHRAPEQPRDMFDDVPVGHRHAKDRCTSVGRSAAEKRPLAFEDSDEPVELKLFYVALCVVNLVVVSMGLCAGRLSGFEPLLGGPQPLVLPLHHSRRGSNALRSMLSLSDYRPAFARASA
jgi:hypothetical protein